MMMKKIATLISVGLPALLLVGCGSGGGNADEGTGKEVKELPAPAPVTSEQQKAAQEAVANDPKAETPRPDGK